jgi:hypothetical protein
MAGHFSKKRKIEDGMKGKVSRPVKKFKKQTDYDNQSSSESEADGPTDFSAVNLQDSDEEEVETTGFAVAEESDQDDEPNLAGADEEEVTDASNSDSNSDSEDDDSETESNPNLIKKKKRNDPEAFSTSMQKILSSKLSTSKRNDPVLARSVTAIQASKEITDQALEKKARHKLREEKKMALDKGRVKDVLGASTAFDAASGREGISVQKMMEEEKALRKIAQRGVVKLFNAVRAAQIKGEQAAKESRTKGVVGQGRREERVNEMSKQGFLELIAGGGGGLMKAGGAIEEA